MSGKASGFTVREPYAEMEGIPVTELGDPLENTLVVVATYKRFLQWCNASGIREGSPKVLMLRTRKDESGHTPDTEYSVLTTVGANWKWVVFTGIEPPAASENRVLTQLNALKANRRFTRAWHYPHLLIRKNVQEPPLLGEET